MPAQCLKPSNLETSAPFWRHALLRSAYSTGMLNRQEVVLLVPDRLFLFKLGIVTHPEARVIDSNRGVTTIVAGSAPTAHLIGELEKKNIQVCHVYGLT